MYSQLCLIILWVVACSARALGAELHVPAQFATIQAAVDAASEGDTVVVGLTGVR